jgi:choice-of-anchor C domain-containing protein
MQWVLIIVTLAIGAATTEPASTTEPAPATNLIVNGDFETPEAPDRCLALSGDQLTGWKIERGDVDVVSTYWPAEHGNQSLDLNGLTSGAISQTIATEPGHWYRLSFFYSGNPDENAADRNRAAEVQWDGKLLTTLHPQLGTLTDMNWQRQEFVVQAKTASTSLLFISVNDGAYGVALDDVSLVPCDPASTQPSWH